MPSSDEKQLLNARQRRYQVEKNTEHLVKAVMADRTIDTLSGEHIWQVLRLTWITKTQGHTSPNHWRKLKLCALEHLYSKKAVASTDLAISVESMGLPAPVARAAIAKTGFINTYNAYRNSLLTWCSDNVQSLRPILAKAGALDTNNQARFDLASTLEQLPPVPTPNGKSKMSASNFLTPLVACLDPKLRFPIINGEDGVRRKLRKLGLADSTLEDQVKGLIGLIGQFGLEDAFAVDSVGDKEITTRFSKSPPKNEPLKTGTTLRCYDDAERVAIQKSGTIVQRQRHNKMTTCLESILPNVRLTQGTDPDCRYDVLASNYDGKDRDLLIEVKPDPDKGSIRIAIGQLLDYRRFLPKQAATDLAILTISPPPVIYIELLNDLQITSLWFTDENCKELCGEGKIWESLKTQLVKLEN